MIFTCNNFRGHYSIGTAAVIIAYDSRHAKQLLLAECKRIGIPQDEEDIERIKIEKISSTVHAAHILGDGNY